MTEWFRAHIKKAGIGELVRELKDYEAMVAHEGEYSKIFAGGNMECRDAIHAEIVRRSNLTQDEALEEALWRTDNRQFKSFVVQQDYYDSMSGELDEEHKALYMKAVNK